MDLIDKYNLKDPVCKFRLNKSELVLSTLAVNILALALPIMVLQVYDRIMVNHSTGTLMVLALGVTAAIVLETILRIARSYITGWAGMLYEYTMDANALRVYINSDPASHAKAGIGEQIQSLNVFAKLRDFYSGQTLVNLIDIPFSLIFLGTIFYLTGFLVLVPIVLIALFFGVVVIMGRNLKRALEEQSGVDNQRYNFIIEALQGIHTIKSFGLEGVFTRKYERLEEESSMHNYKTSLINSEGNNYGILFNEIMIVSLVAFGAPMVMNNVFSTGALVASTLLAGRLVQPVQKILFLWTQFQEYQIAKEEVEKMFSVEQIERESIDEKEVKSSVTIQINNLSFGYGDKAVISNLNLDLKIPDVISIYGDNNSGKATLLRLIAGMSKPTSGEVLINGVNASKYDSESLVKHVGFISPEATIFQGTIMQNITGFDDTMEEQAVEIAKMLNLDKDIVLMPRGYETKITDGVADIVAPGVKQRIAIARVLIHKPKIILFHNADRGLDRDGYDLLIRLLSLLKGQVAMIIVTADKNINLLADREYLLQDGKLVLVDKNKVNNLEVKPYKELKL